MHPMRNLVLALFGLCIPLSAWSQPNTLSDCLLTQRINTPICTAQVFQFEAQYGFVPEIARESGIDPDLILAVIAVESGYSPLKRSDRGGLGPMQVTAIAAKEVGVSDLTYLLADPVNVQAGTRYLRKMMQRFGDWRLALAAYNAGPSAVIRHKGIPPYRETQAYVHQVLWWYVSIKKLTLA